MDMFNKILDTCTINTQITYRLSKNVLTSVFVSYFLEVKIYL